MVTPSAFHYMCYYINTWDGSTKCLSSAHLPLILKPDGNGKLSKRDGDRLGISSFPTQWRNPTTGDISSGYREADIFEYLLTYSLF